MQAPVAISTAALGGSITIPTLKGFATVKVSPGTQVGCFCPVIHTCLNGELPPFIFK